MNPIGKPASIKGIGARRLTAKRTKSDKAKIEDPAFKGSHIPVGQQMVALGFRLFQGRVASRLPLTTAVKQNLLRSGARVGHIVYMEMMVFWSMVASLITLAIFLPVSYLFIFPHSIPFTLGFSSLLVFIGGSLVMAVLYYLPIHRAGNVGRNIEKNLVYTANYMAVMAGVGVTFEGIFSSLAKVGDSFGVRESARAIVRDVEIFGHDILTALEDEAKRTPSASYAEFLRGYAATARTGGDPVNYLISLADKHTENRRRKLSELIQRLALMAEFYVSALVAMPIIIITMLVVMGFIGGQVAGGLSASFLMVIVTYLLLPFAALGFLVMVDTMMSE